MTVSIDWGGVCEGPQWCDVSAAVTLLGQGDPDRFRFFGGMSAVGWFGWCRGGW